MSEPGKRGCLVGCGAVLAAMFAGLAAVIWAIAGRGGPHDRRTTIGSRAREASVALPPPRVGQLLERSPEGNDMGGRRRETLTYLAGYGLALALTLAAFAAVIWPVAAFGGTFAIILTLALAQLIIQFRCFLHVSLARSARADLLLVLFAALIVTLMVSGTLVILFNLRDRMM